MFGVETLRIGTAIPATLLIGLLAGLMLGTGLQGFSSRSLSETNWTSQHQATDALFRQLMPAFFNVTAVALIATAIVARGQARWFFAAAALLVIVSILVTVLMELPLNKEIALWSAGGAPIHWMEVRDRWLRNHVVRTVALVISFACTVAGLTRFGL